MEEDEKVQDQACQIQEGAEDDVLPVRKRVTKQLNPEEDHLADWFRDHPIFYNQVREDF